MHLNKRRVRPAREDADVVFHCPTPPPLPSISVSSRALQSALGHHHHALLMRHTHKYRSCRQDHAPPYLGLSPHYDYHYDSPPYLGLSPLVRLCFKRYNRRIVHSHEGEERQGKGAEQDYHRPERARGVVPSTTYHRHERGKRVERVVRLLDRL